jgi:translation initiation factor IF-3
VPAAWRTHASETQGKGYTISRDLRVNQMIRIPQVRVVDEEGNQLGVMATPAALQMAQDRGYDLVEVAPMAVPPVVKFLDFGQYKYELTKREKEAKRRQRSVTFKEVRLTPKIGSGDFDTKVHRATEFLEDGDRIKVTVRFRGRELTHPELGRNLLQRFTDQIKDHGVVERAPIFEGKSMFVTVASVHKPKVHEAPTKGQAADAPAAPAASPARDEPAAAQPAAAQPAAAQPAAAQPAEDQPRAEQPARAATGNGPAERPVSPAPVAQTASRGAAPAASAGAQSMPTEPPAVGRP